MKTTHTIYCGSSSEMSHIPDNSVNLVVTSPPYPMIEMWDHLFVSADPAIESALGSGDGHSAHTLMHMHLNRIWTGVMRVLTDGGIACINIGDATRKIGDSFALYPNHSNIIQFFITNGFTMLPMIIWRKPSNKPNKFMGSGMLPPNAYVTHEHEFILIFRKGRARIFSDNDKNRRYMSSYFWEERNTWFSDIWTDLKGISQSVPGNEDDTEIRNRSASFPFELPFRLIHMFSIQGDTVIDPFLGTGTTTLAALASGRNSVGYESDPRFYQIIRRKIHSCMDFCNAYEQKRVTAHHAFISAWQKAGKESIYVSERYGFPTVTSQEVRIDLPLLERISEIREGFFEAGYRKADSQTGS